MQQEQSSIELQETFNDSREILTNYDKLKESYITTPVLSKYERTIIGVRAQQISGERCYKCSEHMSLSHEWQF